MSSGLRPSASALKLVMIRCRRTGPATDADVVGRDIVAAVKDRAGLGGQDEVLAGARAGAPADVIADEVGDLILVAAGPAGQADRVTRDVVGDRHFADELLKREDVGSREDLGHRWLLTEVVSRTMSSSSFSAG